LSTWPIRIPKEYITYLNETQSKDAEDAIEKSELRGSPYGEEVWVAKTIKKFGLETTIRERGRPKKVPDTFSHREIEYVSLMAYIL
jgi:putative transposase